MQALTLDQQIEAFLTSRVDEQRSPATLRAHTLWLRRYATWRSAEVPPLDGGLLKAFLAVLRAEGLAPNSVRGAFITLHAFGTWAEVEGLLDADAASSLRRVRAPAVPEQLSRTYDPATFDDLVGAAACQAPRYAARDVTMLHMLRESGMRASELCGLELARVDQEQRAAQVVGKGGGWGWVSWGDLAASALRTWLDWRPVTQAATLFVALHSRCIGAPMTYTALRQVFRRLADAAGVELPRGASIHALRSTFAHDQLAAGTDGLLLQQMMRHRSPEMTARYVRQHPDKLRSAQQAALQRITDLRTKGGS